MSESDASGSESDASGSESDASGATKAELLELTADLVAEYVAHNHLPKAEVAPFFRSVYKILAAAENLPAADAEPPGRAWGGAEVAVEDSVHHDYLVCLEDGQKLTMLKRYLRTRYDMSPEEYRQKWGLPADYPMVAPAQSQKRSKNARKLGLGQVVRRGSKAG